MSDIPLLFETGLQNDFDVVVVVNAPEAVRIERIMRDRELSREEAERMIAAGEVDLCVADFLCALPNVPSACPVPVVTASRFRAPCGAPA